MFENARWFIQSHLFFSSSQSLVRGASNLSTVSVSTMKRQRPKLPNDDSIRTTFHYNTRSSNRRGISDTDRVDESASLRATKRRTKKNIPQDRSTKSDFHLPIDLVVEILKRLPAKTLARFLCVSKIWGSIIRSRDFMKLFLTESSNRPGRLLFTFGLSHHKFFLFSSNQTPNPEEASYHLTHSRHGNIMNYSSRVHDLICYGTGCGPDLVVYNTTTKRSITLPKLDSGTIVQHFLCYDPIDGVYKVLCKTRPRPVFKVLTLAKGNEWREIECAHTQHYPFHTQICINGVLYYDAYSDRGFTEIVVMSFDVGSEKFDLIKIPGDIKFHLKMTMYEGKLAIISTEISANSSLVLWVLEDTVKHEWSKKTFVLPNSWTSLVPATYISSPDVRHLLYHITAAGEFILAPNSTSVPPFYVLYYDPKRNYVRKVCIQGILEHEQLQWNRVKPLLLYYVFSSQVESLMFL